MTPAELARLAAQRRNARVLALVLGMLVVLIFALAVAKIGLTPHPAPAAGAAKVVRR